MSLSIAAKAAIIEEAKKLGLGKVVVKPSELGELAFSLDDKDIDIIEHQRDTVLFSDVKFVDEWIEYFFNDHHVGPVNPKTVEYSTGFLFGSISALTGLFAATAQYMLSIGLGSFGAGFAAGQLFATRYLLLKTGSKLFEDIEYSCELRKTAEPLPDLKQKTQYIRKVRITLQFVRFMNFQSEDSQPTPGSEYIKVIKSSQSDSYGVYAPLTPAKELHSQASSLMDKVEQKINETQNLSNENSPKVDRNAQTEQFEGLKQSQQELFTIMPKLAEDLSDPDPLTYRKNKEIVNNIAESIQKRGIPVTTPSEIDAIQYFFENAEPNLRTIDTNGAPVFLIMGPTGSGKSFFINKLKGNEIVENDGEYQLAPHILNKPWNPQNPPYAPLGLKLDKSETAWVTVYNSELYNASKDSIQLKLADSPGFGNPNKDARERDEFALFLASKGNAKLNGIVLIVNSAAFGTGKMTEYEFLIRELNRVMLDKSALNNHMLLIVNTMGNVKPSPKKLRETIEDRKKTCETFCANYQNKDKEVREAFNNDTEFATSYDAVNKNDETALDKLFLKTRKFTIRKDLQWLQSQRQNYQEKLEELNILKLLDLESDNNSNLLIGNIRDDKFIQVVESRLLAFQPLNKSTAQFFQFDPKPFQKQLMDYLSKNLQENAALQRRYKTNEIERKRLEAINNNTVFNNAINELIGHVSNIGSILESLQDYKKRIEHQQIVLENINQSTWGFYPTFKVKPYTGKFSDATCGNPITDYINEKQYTYRYLASNKETAQKEALAGTLTYQSDSMFIFCPNAPRQAIGSLFGLKANHPEQQGNFEKFKKDFVSNLETMQSFIKMHHSWLIIADKELPWMLSGKISQLLGAIKVLSEQDAEKYLDSVIQQLVDIENHFRLLNAKFCPEQLERLKEKVASHLRIKSELSDSKELTEEKEYLGKLISQQAEKDKQLFEQLVRLKNILNTEAFDFAIEILKPQFSITDSMILSSVLEAQTNISDVIHQLLIPLIFASYTTLHHSACPKKDEVKTERPYYDTRANSTDSSSSFKKDNSLFIIPVYRKADAIYKPMFGHVKSTFFTIKKSSPFLSLMSKTLRLLK